MIELDKRPGPDDRSAGNANAARHAPVPCLVALALLLVGLPAAADDCDERPAPGCLTDTDDDGVVDAHDECPQTRPGAPVTMRGCDHDSDGDGVADYRDRCEDTADATRLTAHGCTLGDRLTLDGVVFESGSARFAARSLPALRDALETLRLNPTLSVEVAGHTDNRGDEADNLALSRERAEAVRAFLVRGGIEPERLTARGYGELEPIASNASVAGRGRNRRVELRITSD